MSGISDESRRQSRLEEMVGDLRVCTARLATTAAERGRQVDMINGRIDGVRDWTAQQISAINDRQIEHERRSTEQGHHVKTLYGVTADNRERIKALESGDRLIKWLQVAIPVILLAGAILLRKPELLSALHP
jgi:hypothetical protein